MTSNNYKFIEKFKEVNNLEIIESQSDLKRLSKDFYNYSPILTEKLDGCIADLVVRPSDHKAVKEVAEICWELSIPLTLPVPEPLKVRGIENSQQIFATFFTAL